MKLKRSSRVTGQVSPGTEDPSLVPVPASSFIYGKNQKFLLWLSGNKPD